MHFAYNGRQQLRCDLRAKSIIARIRSLIAMHDILLIQTGGTIDKHYPRSIGGYAFEIGEPAALNVFQRCRVPATSVRTVTFCKKDSLEIDQADRYALIALCHTVKERRILITHGTDTILETARSLAGNQELKDAGKIIVLVGSFLPECFKDSDADFNLGMAYSALQTAESGGILVAVDGLIGRQERFSRDLETGKFACGDL